MSLYVFVSDSGYSCFFPTFSATDPCANSVQGRAQAGRVPVDRCLQPERVGEELVQSRRPTNSTELCGIGNYRELKE